MTRPYRHYLLVALLIGVLAAFGCGRTQRSATVYRVLDNGLTLVAEENRGTGVAGITIYVGDGGLFEPPETAGTAYLLSLLMFRETETHGPGEIHAAFEDMGTALSSTVQLDYVAYVTVIPSDRLGDATELIVDGLLHTVIDETRMEGQRAQAAATAAEPWTRQIDRAHQEALSLFFGDHPYGRAPHGDPEIIASLTADDLRARYRRAYVPSNMVISIAGDIDAARATDRFAELLEDLEPGERAQPVAEPLREPLGARSVLRGEGPAAAMAIALPAPGIGDPYDVAMDILLVAAGRTRDSRLRSALTVDEELVTDMDAGWYTRIQPSPLFVWITLPPANVQTAEQTVLEVLGGMAEEPLTDEELAKSKTLLEVGYDMEREYSGRMASTNAYWAWVAGQDFWSDYREMIRAVTAEEVMAAADMYLASGRHTTAIVMP